MTLMFDNISLKSSLLPCLEEAKILSYHRTRLGGQIFHVLLVSQKEAFVKIGKSYEKYEIIEEYKNLSLLQGSLPVPEVYDYITTDSQAMIVLEKMPGFPLNSMISLLGRNHSLSIIKDILDALKSVPNSVKNNFEIASKQELKNIKSLIDNNLINKDNFMKGSRDLDPVAAFNKIQNDLNNHNTQVLTHGDLCLPNILVTIGKWSLIDWGKGGNGDSARDLSALEGSLKRNIDEQAFPQVCEMMNIEMNITLSQKLEIYKLMDLFWYNKSL